jgi:1-acyl-sn-glycerol-3-phosphate acyltransferase
LPGRTGPIRIALRVNAPIVPVGISGAGATLPPEAVPRGLTSWWPRRRRIRIRFGAPLQVLEAEGEPDRALLRRETDRLMREISMLVDFSLSEPPHRVPLTDADYASLRAFEARVHQAARQERGASA